jgi:predicted AlkP superfamily pyrophosphatase or phosphodiesterase
MTRLAVINVVGLSRSLLPHAPFMKAFAEKNGLQSFKPAFPAVTCTAQSSMVTGTTPAEHGIVANGWYDRESAEVRFWKQSNHLVRGEKVWDELRRKIPGFTVAKLFWWYNMYSSADYAMTPRPLYPADGRKVFDIHTQPMDLREQVKADLGPFPFPSFWGPAAGIASSQWIANSAKWTEDKFSPTLSLVYLPHLDYPLQKVGPDDPSIPSEVAAIDKVVEDLVTHYEARGVKVMILSEYGISPVSKPIHLNRSFREKGWLVLKDELGREALDCGASKAFAVVDHQVAHVYVNDRSLLGEVRALLESTDGVDEVRAASELWESGEGVDRAGDLIAVSKPDAWFAYYFWTDDAKAPDYARCIDIHRKPGYDPVELYLDPAIRFPKLKIAKFLLKKKLGFRSLMEVIPLDATLVKGSHGRDIVPEEERPVLLGSAYPLHAAEDVHAAILAEFQT